MARYPCDMRMGVNAMCGRVRAVGLNPAGGDVYVFVGRSRKVMKILHWERGGYCSKKCVCPQVIKRVGHC